MESTEYQDIFHFISSSGTIFPNHLTDISTKKLKNQRHSFKTKTKKFFLKGNILWRFQPGNIDGVEVVQKENVKNILAEFHGSAFGGHSGVNKTTDAIKSRYWWFGLTDDVKAYVNTQLCEDWNIKHKITAAYHPQTNGLDERSNQTLKGILRKLVNEHQTDWDQFIDGALFSMRTKPQSTTKYSPFYLVYGREAVYPSQLPKDFGGESSIADSPTDLSEADYTAYCQERQESSTKVKSKVTENVQRAQEKQKKDYSKRWTRSYIEIKEGDQVLVFNSSRAASKKKSDLQANYSGPYTVVDVKGKLATLRNSSGLVLKKKVNVDRLKLFNSTTQQNTDTSFDCPKEINNKSLESTVHIDDNTKIKNYITEISTNGTLQNLIQMLSSFNLSSTPNVYNVGSLLAGCPLQSFIAEVTKENTDEVDNFARMLLPFVRHLSVSLREKTMLTMLLASTCVRALSLYQPVIVIAETLKQKPAHLQPIGVRPLLSTFSRLTVCGETLEPADIRTLEPQQWLSDKVINSFIALIASHQNITSPEHHIFVLLSYTALLWSQGNFNHWMFKKVQYAKYTYIMMPVNINGNHWVLLVVNMKDHTVTLMDSMHGQLGPHWFNLWSQFIQIRNSMQDIKEKFPEWQYTEEYSSKQTDGSSCGIFALMNAECLAAGVPVQVMRQVHVPMYREYVKARLLQHGTTHPADCELPDCDVTDFSGQLVHCGVCGKWYHPACSGQTIVSQECCICIAMYR